MQHLKICRKNGIDLGVARQNQIRVKAVGVEKKNTELLAIQKSLLELNIRHEVKLL